MYFDIAPQNHLTFWEDLEALSVLGPQIVIPHENGVRQSTLLAGTSQLVEKHIPSFRPEERTSLYTYPNGIRAVVIANTIYEYYRSWGFHALVVPGVAALGPRVAPSSDAGSNLLLLAPNSPLFTGLAPFLGVPPEYQNTRVYRRNIPFGGMPTEAEAEALIHLTASASTFSLPHTSPSFKEWLKKQKQKAR